MLRVRVVQKAFLGRGFYHFVCGICSLYIMPTGTLKVFAAGKGVIFYIYFMLIYSLGWLCKIIKKKPVLQFY